MEEEKWKLIVDLFAAAAIIIVDVIDCSSIRIEVRVEGEGMMTFN